MPGLRHTCYDKLSFGFALHSCIGKLSTDCDGVLCVSAAIRLVLLHVTGGGGDEQGLATEEASL